MYTEIDKNKRATVILIIVFIILFSLVGAVVGAVITFFSGSIPGAIMFGIGFFLFACLYCWYMDRYGTKFIMDQNNAVQVDHEDSPELYNIVDELILAAGLPMPEIYIIDDFDPNAFATGHDPEHSAVAVTTGLLKLMNHEELEGVIGHELSHIKNYDIRLSTMFFSLRHLMHLTTKALLFAGFGLVYNFFVNTKGFWSMILNLVISFFGVVILSAGIVIGACLYPEAILIEYAFSRNRESLADASSVELTRNPEGLLHALEKLQRYETEYYAVGDDSFHDPTTNSTNLSDQYSALYFNVSKGNKTNKKYFQRVSAFFENLTSTHPPLEKRIADLKKMSD
ncbi:M48 family metalloprotease [Companilactobacillus sp.]|jgi:heat shock protein HtpX|uniref:M48 family metalloprotease n=1 Tax=Companilactobacillus sp. TaxID=2767905 RepID=UPI0025B9793E|nr:M48 family metalloprotease [Companilactobacillus sp.]MCH4008225.1 M48 family metalloprotease [Companilactobacillus sp.]MCH4051596.1 M48 family metalloprotease [Companilactobacillus sp.]MCH4076168.1 M48 family metalloprotease [Companilactobacillus sp.]MCH4124743.1 M48 family metalloprotease [Companilactobacillus sp.]MCH4131285.1 M48 family metalloprotease [Companilactobacillus sp.]